MASATVKRAKYDPWSVIELVLDPSLPGLRGDLSDWLRSEFEGPVRFKEAMESFAEQPFIFSRVDFFAELTLYGLRYVRTNQQEAIYLTSALFNAIIEKTALPLEIRQRLSTAGLAASNGDFISEECHAELTERLQEEHPNPAFQQARETLFEILQIFRKESTHFLSATAMFLARSAFDLAGHGNNSMFARERAVRGVLESQIVPKVTSWVFKAINQPGRVVGFPTEEGQWT